MSRHRALGAGAAGAALVCLLAVAPDAVSAHDVTGSRLDGSAPHETVLAGVAGAVVLTVLWPSIAGRIATPVGDRRLVRIGPRLTRSLRAIGGVAFLAGVVAALAAGVLGSQVPGANFATVFTWPVWIRGLALLAIVAGSPWNVLSPWRTLYLGLCRLEGGRVAVLNEYPSRLGAWPALAGFLVLVGVIETLTIVPRSPRLTTVVVSGYGLATLAGAVLFGPVWFERADPLNGLYRLLGRVSGVSIDRSSDGGLTLSVRPPWHACTAPVAEPAVAALAVVVAYTVAFDGVSSTQSYQALLSGLREALGIGPPTSLLLYAGGLVVFAGIFVAIARAADALGGADSGSERHPSVDRQTNRRGVTLAFATTLLPVAAAYDVAHNATYVIRSTARLVEIVAASLGAQVGPLDLLGWLPPSALWGSQVGVIALGHAVALVAVAHVATRRYPSRDTGRGQLPVVALLVGYTLASLWLVSAPVVG